MGEDTITTSQQRVTACNDYGCKKTHFKRYDNNNKRASDGPYNIIFFLQNCPDLLGAVVLLPCPTYK